MLQRIARPPCAFVRHVRVRREFFSRPWVGLAGFALGLLVLFSLLVPASPTIFERTVDAPDASRILYGLYNLEANDETTFRWSPAGWGVALLGFTREAPVILSIDASAARPPDSSPAVTQVTGRQATGTSFAVQRPWRTYNVLVHPAGDVQSNQHISLRSTTFAPDDPHDQRRLGIAVKQVQVQQLAPDGATSPLSPRPLFLTAVTLLAVLGLRRAGFSLPWLLLAAVALVILLVTLQQHAMTTIAYWLPTTWFVLGGAALALLLPPFIDWLTRQNRELRRPLAWLGLGVALGIAGTLALWLRYPILISLPLVLSGTLLALAVVVHAPASRLLTGSSGRFVSVTVPALVGITAVALALRVFRINTLPMALFHDEVWHGEEALAIWRDATYRPIFVPRVDLPALLFYLMAPFVGIFGPENWTLRIVPAIAGALVPLALWFALQPMFGRRVALIAAGCMAVSAWGLYMSRWGFPVIFDPLFVLIAIGCVWRGLAPDTGRQRAIGWLLLGGVCTGLALYTYHTGRIAPIIVLLFGLARLLTRPSRIYWPALAAGIIAWSLVVAPFVMYAVTDPVEVSSRVNNVSIFSSTSPEPVPPLVRVQRNLERYALMWHAQGDSNARHYAPDRPMLDPVSGVLLLLGIGMCLARRTALGTAIVLWLLVGVLPGVFSDAAPHAMRSIGALPAACTLVALGLDALLAMRPAGARRMQLGVAVPLLLALASWNIHLYFSTTTDQRVMFHAFETTQTLLGHGARFIANTPASDAPYQVYLWDNVGSTINIIPFLTGDAPVGSFDGTRLSPPAETGALLLLPGDIGDDLRASALRALGPSARLLRSGPAAPDSGAPFYLVYGFGPEAQSIADRLPLP